MLCCRAFDRKFDASCLKILFGFPRYSDCRWRFIDRRRSLHRGIRAAALALPCVSCRIIAARGRRSNRPHIGSAGICGCRCRSCRMELPDHRLRSALRSRWSGSSMRHDRHRQPQIPADPMCGRLDRRPLAAIIRQETHGSARAAARIPRCKLLRLSIKRHLQSE